MNKLRLALRLMYRQLDGVFTAKEAWALYRWAAYLETGSWMLLVFGIYSKIVHLPLYDWYLAIGGSIHGFVFLYYVFIVFFAHRSMKWSVWQMLWAEGLSNIPFGALAFERYIIRHLA